MAAVNDKQYNVLSDIYSKLLHEKDNMDSFFEKFLEMNNLQKKTKKDPVWVTYDKKFAEYSELEQNINLAEYYLENK